MTLQEEVNYAIRQLGKVARQSKTDGRVALRKAAKPLIASARSKAPQSDEPHHRYLNGEMVATYYPGNLRRSIRALTFRRSGAVFVGPNLAGSGWKGVFQGNKVDGYYAHMVEFGTSNQRPQPFMRPTAREVGPAALKIAVAEIKKQIETYANSIAI